MLLLTTILSAVWSVLAVSNTVYAESPSVLFPRPSESRDVLSLDGVWDFSLSPLGKSLTGFKEKWFAKRLRDVSDGVLDMPVPASYNDIHEDKAIRDYIGVAWYQRTFFVPSSWASGRRIWLRFGSVCYAAQVWVNGILITSHEIGHLPFQQEATTAIRFGEENVITVAVDNTLLQTTVPQGTIGELVVGENKYVTQSYTFDFFNYAGIDRSVYLFTTPAAYITDVTVTSALSNNNSVAAVTYTVDYQSSTNDVACKVDLIDKSGSSVLTGEGCSGTLTVQSPKLWWPYLMNPDPGYLYTLKVTVTSGGASDIYRQPFGIRSLTWTNMTVLLNDVPLYLRGFGRHEDSDIRGKGLDLPLIVKDYSLIKWIGANAYRTSHYPYAEEIMDMADQQGIMIIDECPSVDTDLYSATLKENHKTSLTELIRRDKNRPSVIMWSIANEPRTQHPASGPYFGEIAAHVKSLDKSRPVTLAMARSYSEDYAGQYLDVVSFNRYNAWYINTGKLETIAEFVAQEADNWYKKYNKPILMTEYGADTIAGIHSLPDYIWSEEFQSEMMAEHFKAFDLLRSRGYFIGEMIWNFADFMTAQTYTRAGGNKKGIFTRQRQPKAAAHLLRQRYWGLAEELDKVSPPKKLFTYTSKQGKPRRTEL